jgi:RNA polymerase sigma-70 factor (ECF subfamily)
MTETGAETPYKQARDDPFGSTRWSMVLAAGGEGPSARAALENLCQTYWSPVRGYIARRVMNSEDANDLTQAFFTELLDRKTLASANPLRGRFRAYLLTALKNFLANQHAFASAQKRGGGHVPVSLDREARDTHQGLGPVASPAPDQEFDRQWAVSLLDSAISRLASEQAASGKAAQFEALRLFLTGQESERKQKEAAEQLGMTQEAARSYVYRLRKRYRELLRDEVAQTLRSTDEIDNELRDLFAAVSR